MPSRIEDYAFIVDCETAALVSKNGSIAGLCWPWFDWPACFAALLDNANNGRWQVAPAYGGEAKLPEQSRPVSAGHRTNQCWQGSHRATREKDS